MGAFILGSCFIEYLAGFRYGKETTHDDYKNFIKEFLEINMMQKNFMKI